MKQFRLLKPIWLAAMLLLLSSVPLTATAYDFMVDGIAYNINDDGVSVSVTSTGTSPNYKDLEHINIPPRVTYGGKTYQVTAIGYYGLCGAFDVKSVTLPEGLISIGECGLNGLSSITELTLPSTLKSVSGWAFEHIDNAEYINCLAVEAPTINGYWFHNNGYLPTCPFYVPKGSLASYQSSSYWNAFNLQEIRILVSDISLDKELMTLEVGQSETLTATIYPSDADNQTVNWTTSDSSVVTVDQNGVVSALAVGTATITAATTDRNEYEILDYIITPDRSSINTGVLVDNSVIVEMTCQLNNKRDGAPRFFSSNDTNTDSPGWHEPGTWGLQFEDHGNVLSIKALGDNSEVVRTTCVYDNLVARKLRYNLTAAGILNVYDANDNVYYTYDVTSSTDQAVTSSTPIKLFHRYTAHEYFNNQSYVYDIKIWKNNELIRHYIPVKRLSDDVYGFYDVVNSIFVRNEVNGYAFTGQAKTKPEFIDNGNNLTASCFITVKDLDVATIQVGDGTEKTEIEPFFNWWKRSYVGNEVLYLKEEMEGLNKGDKIVSLAYKCCQGSAKGGNFNFRIKNTTQSSFPLSDDRLNTSIFGVNYNDDIYANVTLGSYSAGDWVTVDLSQPFIYEGENIIIDVRNTAPATAQGWCYFEGTKFNYRRDIAWRNANSENCENDGFHAAYDPYGGDDFGVYLFGDACIIPNVRITFEKSPAITTYTVNGVSFNMVDVEGGTFTMGATPEQGLDFDYADELPAHQVTLSGFSIGQTEVTQELWQAVMGSNPSYHTGNLQYPVERVSWGMCQEFIDKLNLLTGKKFRLPTEAEWEFAARGGNKSQGYKYAGSNNADDVAWHRYNSGHESHPVGMKLPNELGLYDMTGNVWERIADWYGPYSGEQQFNPTGPETGLKRCTRGSGFGITYDMEGDPYGPHPVCGRGADYESEQHHDMGLRIVLETENAGDVNGDGRVNVSDVSALINMILGITPMDPTTGDVNGDGRVNVSDVSALINIILGIH